ncbi:uncharacterized protein LOC121739045 [Aricia agestis]|uniref:uncharacterized protein LOC121739045 n=1 Tax=Aricia agestis TaxID=91739 RepID=UPI001C20237A|nr:uncharacterized protein LOC121739045 [Aricia agestis]
MMKLVVLSCLLAAASADQFESNYGGPLSLAPGQPADILGSDGRPLDTLDVNLDRAAHLTAKALGPIAAPAIAAYAASFPLAYSAPLWQPYNYRGPLSLAPGQPANILGADGRPLDTLEVNEDRAAHFAAKTGLHILKKRSAVIAPVITRSTFIPSIYSAPIAPISTLAYSAYSPLAYSAYPASIATFLKK